MSVSTSAAFETSVLTRRASPPASLIIRTVSSPPSTRTSATTVFAPSRANASALALPIPEAAPVTKATLPSNCLVISPLHGEVRITISRRNRVARYTLRPGQSIGLRQRLDCRRNPLMDQRLAFHALQTLQALGCSVAPQSMTTTGQLEPGLLTG